MDDYNCFYIEWIGTVNIDTLNCINPILAHHDLITMTLNKFPQWFKLFSSHCKCLPRQYVFVYLHSIKMVVKLTSDRRRFFPLKSLFNENNASTFCSPFYLWEFLHINVQNIKQEVKPHSGYKPTLCVMRQVCEVKKRTCALLCRV